MKKKYVEYLSLFCLIGALFFGSWKLADHFYSNDLLNQQEEFLTKNGQLLTKQLSPFSLDSAENQRLITTFSKQTDERITLMTDDGKILFDSAYPSLSGDRSNRPEVKHVQTNGSVGSAVRYSKTMKTELLYTAQPIQNENKTIAILRVAKPTSAFEPKTKSFRRSIFVIFLLFYLVIYFIIFYLIYQRNRPLEAMLPVLKRMVAEPEKSNYIMQNSPKWQDLYATINQLSEQLKQTHVAYTSTEEQFQTLYHELMIGVFLIDEEGKFLMINPMMERILHVGGANRQYYWQVIKDNKFIQLIQQVIGEKNQLHEEIALHVPEKRSLDIHLRYLENPSGTQIMGTVYDLTHVRNLEKIQRDFVGNVSHELKTPVTSLIGFTETLLDGAKEDPELTTEFLTIMQQDAMRLQRLIQDIIELSKDGEIVGDEQQTIQLSSFLQQQIKFYHHLLTEKKITVRIEGNEHCHVQTQLIFFQPIIKNLLENAIQYSAENSKITIAYAQKEKLTIQVIDSGVGISKKDQERIFERFYRVDKARSRHSGGTGLGLAIVKEYSEILGGTVTVESYPNVGSTFTVTLPVDQTK